MESMSEETIEIRERMALRNKRWPNGIVYYKISPTFTNSEKKSIEAAMKEIEKHSCIKFVPVADKRKYFVQIRVRNQYFK